MSTAVKLDRESGVYFGRRPEPGPPPAGVPALAENTSSPYKFAYARTALKYGLTASGIGAGDGVLVPDFVCEAVVEPLDQLGIAPLYYPILPTLEPDWAALDQLSAPSAKAFLIVHYFGQPQDIGRSIEFCRARSLVLIEDNAHGFGGTLGGQLLGTFGQIGISAPRKSFPIRSGAYLHIAGGIHVDCSLLRLQPLPGSPARRNVKRLVRGVPPFRIAAEYRRRLAEHHRRRGPAPAYASQEAFREPPLRGDYGMDELAHQFLQRADIPAIRQHRHRIYQIWNDWTCARGLQPVCSSLSPEALPLVLPAYADSPAESVELFERGHRAGIDIHSWPTLPRAIAEQNGSAMRLWERLVCFPIHQGMDLRTLEARLRSV